MPAPPVEGSAELAADLAVHRATARWQLATDDVLLKWPAAANTFSGAMDLPISQERTPHLNMLLRRSLLDAGLATYAAKDNCKRQRPFARLNESTCSPAEEKHLSTDGSYPSGHASLGWAWALVLTQVAPERADARAEVAVLREQSARSTRDCAAEAMALKR